MKECYTCKTGKEESEFYPSQFIKGSGICKRCWRNMPSQRPEGKREYHNKNPDKVKEWKQKDYINNRKQYLLTNSKNRAIDNNLEFNITLDDIVWPILCPILDIPIVLIAGDGRNGNGPSIDRIDNKRGYTKDNILIVSDRANSLKRDGNQEERERIYKFYKELL